MPLHERFTVPEQANFLAAQAVAAATSYLGGRSTCADLAEEADRVFSQLQTLAPDPCCAAIVDPTRLLVTAMIYAAVTTGPRAERWADIMNAFVGLLRLESHELAASGAQRQ
jgi:hypothetical protein